MGGEGHHPTEEGGGERRGVALRQECGNEFYFVFGAGESGEGKALGPGKGAERGEAGLVENAEKVGGFGGSGAMPVGGGILPIGVEKGGEAGVSGRAIFV